MTNFEKKKDECMKILAGEMALVDGKPTLCEDTNCYNCAFYKTDRTCHEQAMEWLLAEYQEPAPKLTKREREFLECFSIMGTKKISRNHRGLFVGYFFEKNDARSFEIDGKMFPFVKPGESWSFEELMKLEVEE